MGGSAEDGIRVSKRNFLIVLLSIVRLDISGLGQLLQNEVVRLVDDLNTFG